MSTTAPAPIAYDLPGAHVALIRHEVVATLRTHKRYLAADLALTADTRAAWELIEREVDGLSGHPSGTVYREVLSRVCFAMATGRADQATVYMARDCGMSVEEWAADVRREMSRAVSA